MESILLSGRGESTQQIRAPNAGIRSHLIIAGGRVGRLPERPRTQRPCECRQTKMRLSEQRHQSTVQSCSLCRSFLKRGVGSIPGSTEGGSSGDTPLQSSEAHWLPAMKKPAPAPPSVRGRPAFPGGGSCQTLSLQGQWVCRPQDGGDFRAQKKWRGNAWQSQRSWTPGTAVSPEPSGHRHLAWFWVHVPAHRQKALIRTLFPTGNVGCLDGFCFF